MPDYGAITSDRSNIRYLVEGSEIACVIPLKGKPDPLKIIIGRDPDGDLYWTGPSGEYPKSFGSSDELDSENLSHMLIEAARIQLKEKGNILPQHPGQLQDIVSSVKKLPNPPIIKIKS